jgi:RNA polymerase sigma-70 factor (ECF subfamily)
MHDRQDPAEARFTQLYRETRHDVLAYLIRRSPSLDAATEALAETYAAAWRKQAEIPEGPQARLWLFGVARNELRMSARRARSDDRLTQELAEHLRTVGPPPTQTGNETGPIDHALATLSAIDYEIVTLTAWEELAPREIAAVLGLSPNVVRIRLHRARNHLRASLQDHEPHIAQAITRSGAHAEAS